jgi:transcription initiation factor TFIID subunit TAF12
MHSVHGLVRKAPMIKQLQDSTMFIVELAEMVKDFKTGEKTYSNYKAMLFAKTEAAIAYYTKATAEGSFIVLVSEKIKVETFDANSGKTYITLMMDNARLEGAHFDNDNQPSQQVPQQQQQAPAQQAAPQQQPQQQPNNQQPPQSWGNAPGK